VDEDQLIRRRKLKLSDAPPDVREFVEQQDGRQVPWITIKRQVKEQFDYDVDDKTIKNYTEKKEKLEVPSDIGNLIEKQLKKSTNNIGAINDLLGNVVAKAATEPLDPNEAKALRDLQRSIFDIFQGLMEIRSKTTITKSTKKEDVDMKLKKAAKEANTT